MHDYGLNIGRLLDDYRDFTIMAARNALGWRARYRDGNGSRGSEVKGRTLNELAERMDSERDRQRDIAMREMTEALAARETAE